MMMLSSVTIAMTRDVTPLMSPTMSLNRRRTVKRTSEKPVSYRLSRMPFGQLMAEFSNSPTGGGWIHGLVKI